MRPVYFILGWFFVALGVIGAFLPVMPTTPFMLLALWAFANSSQRFHDWLYYHPFFGPPLQQWKKYRVIPMMAKIASVSMMSASLIYLVFFTQSPQYVNILVGFVMLYAAWFIVTKPSVAPTDTQ
ncbi:YbaN family protein [Kaarinaea lacus]